MARTRAEDYDDKRRAILKAAASLFAELGYDRASMAEVAKACGVSKPLVYHYYASKEALLFDMLEQHLAELVEAVAAADDPALPPRARLEALAVALLETYRDANAEHQIQIAELGKMPREQQEALKALERALVRRFSDALGAARPELAEARLLTPVTMSLFGMLNWHYLWHREGGPLGRADYARLAVALVLDGASS
jgi:TetR/AcrR family transcriptional regulator